MIGNLAALFPASVSRPMASILVVGTTRSAGLNWSDAPAFAWVWVDIVLFLCSIGSGRPDRDGRAVVSQQGPDWARTGRKKKDPSGGAGPNWGAGRQSR